MNTEEKFKKYSKKIETNNEYVTNNCTNDDLLILYAFFKQATDGDCNIDEPYFYEIRKKSKYNAWMDIKGTSQKQAMECYIKKAKEILPTK